MAIKQVRPYEFPRLRWTAFLFALFHIYCNVFASISELWLSAIHFGGFGAICMFMANEALSDGKQSAQYWINLGLALLTIASTGYLVLFENALYARETQHILSDQCFQSLRSRSPWNSLGEQPAGSCPSSSR